MSLNTDVVVIGAGPVGLFSVFQLGMLGMSAHVIDALDALGGQCTALYPEKPIYDIPAYPQIAASDLIDQLIKQAEPFNPTYHLGHQVTHLEKLSPDGRLWKVVTSKGLEIQAKSIILAAGVGAFGPNRPPLEGLERYEGTSIFYAVRSAKDFANKRIVIAGGGDSAVDWAIALSDKAQSVAVVHRRDKFRAMPESESRLKALVAQGKIELVVPYQLHGLEGEGAQLSGVVVSTLDGQVRTLPADVLLPFFGLSMNLGPILTWGLALEKQQIAVDPTTAQTSEPGIYAVGDISTYPHKLKLILCGFSEAAQAIHHIRHFLNPEAVFHFEYSTTKGLPVAG